MRQITSKGNTPSASKNTKDFSQLKEVPEGSIEADRDKQRYDEESPINIIGGQLWSCNFAISRLAFDHLGRAIYFSTTPI